MTLYCVPFMMRAFNSTQAYEDLLPLSRPPTVADHVSFFQNVVVVSAQAGLITALALRAEG